MTQYNPLRRASITGLAAIVCAGALLVAAPAQAESCDKSRNYLLGGSAGELPAPPQAYQSLYKTCLETVSLPNIKDAFVLRDGGIAVIPKQDTISATAATLSRFCDAHPRATLRFLSRKDLQRATSVARIVQMSSTGSTSCAEIKGNAQR